MTDAENTLLQDLRVDVASIKVVQEERLRSSNEIRQTLVSRLERLEGMLDRLEKKIDNLPAVVNGKHNITTTGVAGSGLLVAITALAKALGWW